MFWFALAILISLFIAWRFWIATDEEPVLTFLAFCCSTFLTLLLALPMISLSGGMKPGYSQGFRDGYVTKISHRGLLWKTWEGTMQSGSGELASVQSEYEFSVVDDELVKELALAAAAARRVRLVYSEYLITDWRKSESGYLIMNVEYLE